MKQIGQKTVILGKNIREIFVKFLNTVIRQRLTHFLKILEIFKISKIFSELCRKYYKCQFLHQKISGKCSSKLARQRLTGQRLTHFSSLSTIKMRQSLAKDCMIILHLFYSNENESVWELLLRSSSNFNFLNFCHFGAH